jgi:hypothetical protein
MELYEYRTNENGDMVYSEFISNELKMPIIKNHFSKNTENIPEQAMVNFIGNSDINRIIDLGKTLCYYIDGIYIWIIDIDHEKMKNEKRELKINSILK